MDIDNLDLNFLTEADDFDPNDPKFGVEIFGRSTGGGIGLRPPELIDPYREDTAPDVIDNIPGNNPKPWGVNIKGQIVDANGALVPIMNTPWHLQPGEDSEGVSVTPSGLPWIALVGLLKFLSGTSQGMLSVPGYDPNK